jgi:antitoxin component of RelBE/YafQ-DinJ toxin-antitoxin module
MLTTDVRCRIDTKTNRDASDMIEVKVLNTSAIHIYLKCVAAEGAIPIDLHIPNAKRLRLEPKLETQKNMPTL